MNQTFYAIAALMPFIIIFYLIINKKMHAYKVIPIAWITAVIIGIFVWQMAVQTIWASFFKGTLITIEILLILFTAVWIIEIFKEKHHLKDIQRVLRGISNDVRIQVLVIGFLLISLIEGVAGFGTPAVIVIPLLVSVGFAPTLAVLASMMSYSSAVSFGAAGTPVLLGLGSQEIVGMNIIEITKQIATIHSIIGIIVPAALVILVIKYWKSRKKTDKTTMRLFIETIPFMILLWVSYIIPYLIMAYKVGPELPSIVGGLTAIIITSIAAKYKILTPKNVISLNKKEITIEKKNKKTLIISLIPYISLIVLLAVSRIIPEIKSVLVQPRISIDSILGTKINYAFNPFYSPAFFFLIAAILAIILFKIGGKGIKRSLVRTWNHTKLAAIALLFTLVLVQIFLMSGNNLAELASMPLLVAQTVTGLLGKAFIIISPFIGVFGAFITGTNTVSNLLFGSLQASTAIKVGLPLTIILALQVVGGAIGNMIALHNIITAEAAAGLTAGEGKTIRKTIKLALLYATLAAIVGIIMMITQKGI